MVGLQEEVEEAVEEEEGVTERRLLASEKSMSLILCLRIFFFLNKIFLSVILRWTMASFSR